MRIHFGPGAVGGWRGTEGPHDKPEVGISTRTFPPRIIRLMENEGMVPVADKRCSLDLNLPLFTPPPPSLGLLFPLDHTASWGLVRLYLRCCSCSEKPPNRACFLEGIQGFPPPPNQLLRSNEIYFKCLTYKIYYKTFSPSKLSYK